MRVRRRFSHSAWADVMRRRPALRCRDEIRCRVLAVVTGRPGTAAVGDSILSCPRVCLSLLEAIAEQDDEGKAAPSMAMYELDGNHLLPVRLGRSADAITLSHSLVAIQRQIVDVLRRPLFPLAWDELDGGASLTALDATGQVVVVEVLESVDSAGLLSAMSRLTQAAAAGRREIASRYAGGLGAFSQDWNEFREAMPAQVEPGPRLTILSASLEPDVVGGLGVLASSGLEIHEVDVRIVDESRIVVVVEKISGTDVAAGGPLLVARAPRPALAGSAGEASTSAAGSRALDASEQAEQMSPVTGPIEIVLPPEPVDEPEADAGDGDVAIPVGAFTATPAGAFAATGAADALSELFEPVAVTAEQPQVPALADQDGAEARSEDGPADSAEGPDTTRPEGGDPASRPADDASQESADASGAEVSVGPEESPPEDTAGDAAGDGTGHAASDTVSYLPEADEREATGNLPALDADAVAGAVDENPENAEAVESSRPEAAEVPEASDASDAAEARAIAALAGGVDILGGSSLSGGGGSAASAASARSDEPLGAAVDGALGARPALEASGTSRDVDSHTRMGRRSRAAQVPSQEDASSASPTSHAAAAPAEASGAPEAGGHSARAAEAWSTVAPNEARPEAPTGAVPLVSWEPLRGSADALDPVAEALGGDPSKSLLVQETAELAAVAATLGEPTQLIWQRLRRGIYHEAILSVEGVITLSDGRSFTDPTSAANAAQDVTDADGWRVWRVGVRGAHLGDLRDDLADRSS